MSFTPTKGPIALIKTAAAPSGTPATIPAINWKLDIDGKLKDISNFAVGRFPQGTLEDADLSCTLVWDSASMPHDPAGAGIDTGLDILVKCLTDATLFYSGTFTISTVGPGVSAMEDVLMYDVKGKLKGVLTRPVIS